MFIVQTYMTLDYESFDLIADFNEELDGWDYKVGAIKIVIDNEEILSLDLWNNSIDDYWESILVCMREISEGKNFSQTTLPGTSIYISFALNKEDNSILIKREILTKKLRKNVLEDLYNRDIKEGKANYKEFFTKMINEAKNFYQNINRIVKNPRRNYPEYLDFISRLENRTDLYDKSLK